MKVILNKIAFLLLRCKINTYNDFNTIFYSEYNRIYKLIRGNNIDIN